MTNKELIDKVRALWVQWGGMPMFVEELDKIEEALPPEGGEILIGGLPVLRECPHCGGAIRLPTMNKEQQ